MSFLPKMMKNLKKKWIQLVIRAKRGKKVNSVSVSEEDKEIMEDTLAEKTLMNELVLDEIFSNLSLEDIKSCRQVCSNWCNTGHKFMCKKAAISLPLYQFSASNTINEALCSEYRLPCNCIRVIDPPLKKCSIFDDFIVKYGEEIKELELETITICKKEFNYFQEILFQKLPSLESLSFGAIQVKVVEEEEPQDLDAVPNSYYLNALKRVQCVQRSSVANSVLMQNFLRNIFERSPNLEEVKANNASFVKFLVEKLPERTITNFKDISLVHDKRSGATTTYLEKLSEKGLRLKNFEWEDSRKNPDFDDLVAFLQTQKYTLKTFTLALTQYNLRNEVDLPSLPQLPMMKNLESLYLSSVSPMYFQQKDWTAQFPALKRFHYSTLNKYPLQSLLTLLRIGECSPNKQLEYIKISSYHEIDILALKQVSYLSYKTFPGLKTFVYQFRKKEIVLSRKELLRYLPKEFPQALEGLKII